MAAHLASELAEVEPAAPPVALALETAVEADVGTGIGADVDIESGRVNETMGDTSAKFVALHAVEDEVPEGASQCVAPDSPDPVALAPRGDQDDVIPLPSSSIANDDHLELVTHVAAHEAAAADLESGSADEPSTSVASEGGADVFERSAADASSSVRDASDAVEQVPDEPILAEHVPSSADAVADAAGDITTAAPFSSEADSYAVDSGEASADHTADVWPYDLVEDVGGVHTPAESAWSSSPEEDESRSDDRAEYASGTADEPVKSESAAEPSVAPSTSQAPLLDEELSAFELSAEERVHAPTPIPGFDALDSAFPAESFPRDHQPVPEAPDGPDGRDSAEPIADFACSSEGIANDRAVRGGSDPRGATAPGELLSAGDEALLAFTQQAAVHAHVIDTLEAVARRVRNGEIVPVTSASATPEAVLASVLASLLTPPA